MGPRHGERIFSPLSDRAEGACVYDAPEEELDEDEFAQALAENGLRLDLKSQILFTESGVYANGERLEITESDRPIGRRWPTGAGWPPGVSGHADRGAVRRLSAWFLARALNCCMSATEHVALHQYAFIFGKDVT